MKLLREIRQDSATGAIDLQLDLTHRRPGGITVELQSVSGSPFAVSSGSALGNWQLLVQSAQIISDSPMVFGGPCPGPFVRIQSGNGAGGISHWNVKIWDEPMAPFGALPVDANTQAGIAAAAFSSEPSFVPGSWVNYVTLLENGDQPHGVFVSLRGQNQVGVSRQIATAAAAGATETTIRARWDQVGFRAQNNGAAAMQWQYFIVQHLGS